MRRNGNLDTFIGIVHSACWGQLKKRRASRTIVMNAQFLMTKKFVIASITINPSDGEE